MNTVPHALCVLLVLTLFSPYIWAQKAFHGDRVLELAGRQYQGATPPVIKERLQALMEHLQTDTRTRARLLVNVDPYLPVEPIRPGRAARFTGLLPRLPDRDPTPLEKSEKPVSFMELNMKVLVAKQDVVIATLKDSVVIAGGNVRVGIATNAIIVSGGSISIAHDGVFGGSGFYVSRDRIHILHAATPALYALQGATVSFSGRVVAYNTDISEGSHGALSRLTLAPVFSRESARRQDAASMEVNAGSDIAYAGQRCGFSSKEGATPPGVLQLAEKKHACPVVESVQARCVYESVAPPVNIEHWFVNLCGKIEVLQVRSSGDLAPPVPGSGVYTRHINRSINYLPDVLSSVRAW